MEIFQKISTNLHLIQIAISSTKQFLQVAFSSTFPVGSVTDDRVCCENIAGGNVCNCERDEGRPLVTVLQEMVTNQCMLLCLRDKVVSDTPKGDINRQVTVQEMTARELLMKHRKLFRRCQNRVFSVRPGINPEGTCLRSGWHPVQR